MKNWKTMIGGALSAIGLSMTAAADATTHTVGIVLAAVGAFLTGAAAKDFDKTGVN